MTMQSCGHCILCPLPTSSTLHSSSLRLVAIGLLDPALEEERPGLDGAYGRGSRPRDGCGLLLGLFLGWRLEAWP